MKQARLSLCLVVALPVLAGCSAAASATPCLQLESQRYCLAWSAHDRYESKSEFVRPGETVNRWQNMVTITRYYQGTPLSVAITQYLAIVRQYMGPSDHPVWIKPEHMLHGQEASTRLVLSTADQSDVEYVIVYFFSDPGKPTFSVILSQHVPLPAGQDSSMAQYKVWLDGLRAIPAAAITR